MTTSLHWPFAAKHPNCAECDKEYEPPPVNLKLKCFVGNFDGRYQGLVVATSKKRAAEVVGTSLYDFNQHWHRAISVKISEFKPDTFYRKRFDSKESWTEAAASAEEGAGN